MHRLQITVSDEVATKLQKRKNEKGVGSLSQCAKELLDFGLKMEEEMAASAQASPLFKMTPEKNEKDVPKDLVIDTLNWVLETRLLVRALAENLIPKAAEKDISVLDRFKKRAEDFIRSRMKGK